MIGSHFSFYNGIDNHGRMRHSGVALEKYLATQSVYFKFSNSVELGVGITDGKLLFYHGISYQSKDKTTSMRKYNHTKFYD